MSTISYDRHNKLSHGSSYEMFIKGTNFILREYQTIMILDLNIYVKFKL